MSRISSDSRIDPRLKAAFGAMPDAPTPGNVVSRDALLAEYATEAARQAFAAQTAMFEAMDSEAIAPSKGPRVSTEQFTARPDGNTVKVLFIRPDTTERVPCVCYLHGGAMQFWSAFDGLYRAWGRLLAAQGVAVALIDFRNAVVPSSGGEVAPFPAGLNDCVAGVRWVRAEAARLGVDPARIVIAGESGGGNLTLASGLKLLRDGDVGVIKGLYALSPYLAGQWPNAVAASRVLRPRLRGAAHLVARRHRAGATLSRPAVGQPGRRSTRGGPGHRRRARRPPRTRRPRGAHAAEAPAGARRVQPGAAVRRAPRAHGRWPFPRARRGARQRAGSRCRGGDRRPHRCAGRATARRRGAVEVAHLALRHLLRHRQSRVLRRPGGVVRAPHVTGRARAAERAGEARARRRGLAAGRH